MEAIYRYCPVVPKLKGRDDGTKALEWDRARDKCWDSGGNAHFSQNSRRNGGTYCGTAGETGCPNMLRLHKGLRDKFSALMLACPLSLLDAYRAGKRLEASHVFASLKRLALRGYGQIHEGIHD